MSTFHTFGENKVMKTFGKAKMGLSESTSFDPIIHLIQLHPKFTHMHKNV